MNTVQKLIFEVSTLCVVVSLSIYGFIFSLIAGLYLCFDFLNTASFRGVLSQFFIKEHSSNLKFFAFQL